MIYAKSGSLYAQSACGTMIEHKRETNALNLYKPVEDIPLWLKS